MSSEALTPEKNLPAASARHPGQPPEGGWVSPAPPESDASGAGPGSSAELRQRRPSSPPLGVGLGETGEKTGSLEAVVANINRRKDLFD